MFERNENGEQDVIKTEPNTIYAPLDGQVITLEEINDGVFSSGALGSGCGIKPVNETVVAPFSGEVVTVAETKHAVGIVSEDGIEVLIHVGLDTVAMNGKGFHVLVKKGDKVKCGQKLLTFNKSDINAAGFSDTTAVLVTNSDNYQEINVCGFNEIKSKSQLIIVR